LANLSDRRFHKGGTPGTSMSAIMSILPAMQL
jgi:hypothetical protein